MKIWYSKKNMKDGVLSIKHWTEDFKDEDTGDVISIKRQRPIRLNGKKLTLLARLPKGIKPLNLSPVKKKGK